MLRLLPYILALLHLGPGFAFMLLAFGCDPVTPALGSLCNGNQMTTFLQLTGAAWLVMGLLLALWLRRRAMCSHAGIGC